MTLKYKCTFGLAEGKKYECDAKARSKFAWTVQRYCSSIYRHRSQPVTNYNYAPCGSLQHWLGHTCIKRSFCLYVGLKRRSSMKRDLRPSLRNDFGRSCFFVWDLRHTEARPQQTCYSYVYLSSRPLVMFMDCLSFELKPIRSWLYSFCSRAISQGVSFHLGRFLMRQHHTKTPLLFTCEDLDLNVVNYVIILIWILDLWRFLACIMISEMILMYSELVMFFIYVMYIEYYE
jgi:hypothetical protein